MDYENFCAEGGGIRGVAYAGVIQSLDELGIRKTLRRFTGSSIGSLYASLLALNVPTDKITETTLKIDRNKIQTNPCMLTKIYRLFRYNGIDDNSLISDFVRWVFRHCGIDPDITMKEMYKNTNNELYIPGTNINRGKVYFFSHYTHPRMPIWKAITISMCFPWAWRPFEMNGDLWYDAGISENYPIYIFNDLEKLKHGKSYDIPRHFVDSKTLGIKLLTNDERNTRQIFYGRIETGDFFSVVMALINTMLLQVELGDVSQSYIDQTIPIPNLGSSLFRLEKTREEIIAIGRESVHKYFERYKNENKDNDETKK